jgi:hypothetical protein
MEKESLYLCLESFAAERILKPFAMWKVETECWRKAERKTTMHLVRNETQESASVLAFVDAVVFARTVTAAAGVILAAAAAAAAGGVILAAASGVILAAAAAAGSAH